MTAAPGGSPVLSLNTLVRLGRGQHTTDAEPPRRLSLPDGMTAPLGCDAVAVPAHLGPLITPRLPRVGCVYADRAHWWLLVPSDSDYAMDWPAPAQYVTDALVPDVTHLIHRPDGTVPYTPPIPLYLNLCRVIGATPTWSHPITA
ncbi:hypothetical protein [Streptomyces sp. NPDC057877]|uniref:hypothetical protein n=1 Tax=Streptomyces sp. NPDC057877 TaxID=3346269 RepID=UPI0036BC1715